MQAKHAVLSPSAAFRWMACPPSAKLEATVPDEQSDAAAEGTAAHYLAELYIKYNSGVITKRKFNAEKKKFTENSDWYSQEMEETITSYVDTVWEIYNEMKKATPDAQILSEHKVDLSDYVPDCFGTVDVTIVADNLLQIIDLKYGKGVRIDAPDNPQLRLYALGSVEEQDMLYDIKRVKMTIIQPRLDHVSTDEMSVEDLKAWADTKLKPAAELAAEGKGDFCPGESQCRFCKMRDRCRARADANLQVAKADFGKLPPELTDEDVAKLLPKLDELISWAKDLQAYALDAAVKKGVKFSGYKLVEGRSIRKYTDEDKVADILRKAAYSDADIFEKKLLGITKMEKLLGKKRFGDLLDGYIEKPTGKPALVPESDKRPEIGSAASAKKDFE